MPFEVRLILPSRKALLFETPLHAPVPSMKVFESCCMYSIALIVSGLLITT